MRPLESRTQDVQRDERADRGLAFAVRVERGVECEGERLELWAPSVGGRDQGGCEEQSENYAVHVKLLAHMVADIAPALGSLRCRNPACVLVSLIRESDANHSLSSVREIRQI